MVLVAWVEVGRMVDDGLVEAWGVRLGMCPLVDPASSALASASTWAWEDHHDP